MTIQLSKHSGALVAAALIAACAVAEESDSAWTLGTDPEVTWETVHVLSQTSSLAVLDASASNEVLPVLSFRCTEGGGDIAMQIDWQRFISSFNTEAGFQVDDGNRNWMKLGVDGTNEITLSRSSSDVASLIEALDTGDVLNVEVPPYSEPSIFAEFDLSGFADAVAELKAACGS